MTDQATVRKVRKLINDYSVKYNIQNFETSSLYDVKKDWLKPWKHAADQGVYAIFGPSKLLLYVGKASLRSSLGKRLVTYFKNSSDGLRGEQRKHHTWSEDPQFILTIRVNKPWEAPSLEEYLINKLQPKDNTNGIHRKSK
ncbi:MAG: GIY-YIG nuclease family protein [Rhodospirillaceae bacterium]|jgi:excinuclease UvrABC nuclease subunit|nr:GIY-YIG nuclease family protein [Rhodospirillaceae bacterium]MBT7955719.1 GIY-YIG nuclease family protein [Rhodospirillaceae bacterium]